MDEFLTYSDLEKVFKKSRPTIWRWCKRPDFPKPVKTGPNSVGFLRSEVEKFIEKLAIDRGKAA